MEITNLQLTEIDIQTGVTWYAMDVTGAEYLDNGRVEYGITDTGNLLDSEGYPAEGHYEFDGVKYEIAHAQL